MADDDILNSDQCQEDHESHNVIAAYDELPEGLDYVPRGAGAFIPVQKNAAAAGNVQRDAQ